MLFCYEHGGIHLCHDKILWTFGTVTRVSTLVQSSRRPPHWCAQTIFYTDEIQHKNSDLTITAAKQMSKILRDFGSSCIFSCIGCMIKKLAITYHHISFVL